MSVEAAVEHSPESARPAPLSKRSRTGGGHAFEIERRHVSWTAGLTACSHCLTSDSFQVAGSDSGRQYVDRSSAGGRPPVGSGSAGNIELGPKIDHAATAVTMPVKAGITQGQRRVDQGVLVCSAANLEMHPAVASAANHAGPEPATCDFSARSNGVGMARDCRAAELLSNRTLSMDVRQSGRLSHAR